jgi:hypothetical protein
MDISLLPKDLQIIIGAEPVDFVVPNSRVLPLRTAAISLFISLAILGLAFVFGAMLYFSTITFEANVISQIFFIVMQIIGVILFGFTGLLGLYNCLTAFWGQKAIVVGTPKRLIYHYKGKTNTMDWSLFSGKTELSGTSQKGDLSLYLLTTHKITTRKSDIDVPNLIFICGITDPLSVQKLCQKRIEQSQNQKTEF